MRHIGFSDKFCFQSLDFFDIDLRESREDIGSPSCGKYILMTINEVPVEMSHRAGFFLHWVLTTVTIITHLLYIVPTGDIGLGREATSVTILTHPHDIGRDHPLEGISIHLIEPPRHLEWMIASQKRIIPDDHESLDMVWIVMLLDSTEYRINTIHSRDSSFNWLSIIAPPILWDFLLLLEAILRIDIIIIIEIELSHILSPTEDLSHESLLRRERHMPTKNSLDDFLRM